MDENTVITVDVQKFFALIGYITVCVLFAYGFVMMVTGAAKALYFELVRLYNTHIKKTIEV